MERRKASLKRSLGEIWAEFLKKIQSRTELEVAVQDISSLDSEEIKKNLRRASQEFAKELYTWRQQRTDE